MGIEVTFREHEAASLLVAVGLRVVDLCDCVSPLVVGKLSDDDIDALKSGAPSPRVQELYRLAADLCVRSLSRSRY